ncbi:LysR substrate-binding domain-containing protein [uncultured Paraburkholderia sp.]|uniref:LysR substrate-binding domain-containing protein n=1 Tax=uncultured Paraburkholderia sp. TaxID=1822466 RepID=UPI00259804FE|nr:LysR substrate-binding domain-containing protein [uncultured Paraburkholderia sp.]
MKLRQLQCLCAVADAGFNISRAANVLHATQPAVGKQVRELEDELGIDLFRRQGGRVTGLTDGGERTLQWARRALQCADNIRSMAREMGDHALGSVAIATSHAHATYILLPPVSAFSRAFPKLRINVLQGTPDRVAELVRDGKVQLGVTHLPARLPPEVVAIPFLTSPRVLVTPLGHDLLTLPMLTLEALADYRLIVPHSPRPEGGRILRKFEEAGLEADLAVQALDADVVKTYVEAGLGVGIIPAFCYHAQRDRGLEARDAGHLFEPAVSAVLLRRGGHLPGYIHSFLGQLCPELHRERLEREMMTGQ